MEAVPSEAIEDKFDDLKKTAIYVAQQAAQVAQHAGEVASQRLEGLQQTAVSFGGSASDKAHQVSGSATASALTAKDALQTRAATLRDSASDLKDSAVSLKNSFQERALRDLEAGKAEAENAKAAAKATAKAVGQKAAKQSAEVTEQGTEAAKQGAEVATANWEKGKAKFAAKKDDLITEAPQIESPIQIEYADQSSKWLWILLGVAVGVALALLFAPTSGRRSRAAIKDRLGKVGDGVVDAASAASDKAVDVVHRAEGMAHKAGVKLAADVEGDDDGTITDRVKSILGHNEVTKHIERLNVDTADGVVTLRGPMLDPAAQDIIIAAVKAVPGVKEVVVDFLTDEEPADASTYAG